jgi:4-hydroxy-tetrahydrodipicolinate reductase
MISICVAGATGWVGREIATAVLGSDDLKLHSAVARQAVGADLGEVLGRSAVGVRIQASVSDALDGVDVLVDYTSHLAVRANVLTAIQRGVDVVVGASGLTSADYAEIDDLARERRVGVISAGNFSLTAAMAQAAAVLVARHLPRAEIIDYAYAEKPDAPSGTARELAERLGDMRPADGRRTREPRGGPIGARGMDVAGTPIHSIRLPSFSVSTEVIFGLPGERLSIRHDAGSSAEPYVSGTLLAIRRVQGRVGLTRGLDTLLSG